MTAAEQLKEEMQGTAIFDKEKVIEAVKNGIKRDGKEGFAVITYHHPASYRPIGYKVMLY